LKYRRPTRQPDDAEWGWDEKNIIAAASPVPVTSNMRVHEDSNLPIIHESVDPTLKGPLLELLREFQHVFSRSLSKNTREDIEDAHYGD